ncbi:MULTISPECIES: hypothetical protein [unclassified Leifsonia]|uniref:hypothetical protein n=1 Tax=unclassified Leifsonia TaxID=2663824 RepID=UPI0007003252|nr:MULTISPECIES: hypothetical protein [unclassified Leifsonia]KQX07646.1 hypothetical protein ASC59_07910 [Leifsonia sp. Root1293]KRA11928.1 hypothetical protein ASD61_07910 [Leifsonia sp. Root60]
MPYIVLGLMLVQAGAGVALLIRWMQGKRPGGRVVVAHVTAGLLTVALWSVFVIAGSVWAAWTAFVVMSVGNAVGDSMLIKRWQRTVESAPGFWPSYGAAIAAVFAGRMPRTVAFHALFAGVVYFAALAACIAASVA